MSNAFASLQPANDLARLAFSDLYSRLTARRQSPQADSHPALQRIAVEPKQIFDGDVLRIRLERERRVSQNAQNAYLSDAETSRSLSELDSDTELQHQDLGMIWTGRYLLKLDNLPSAPDSGYTVGKGPLEGVPSDLLLCTTKFANWHDINLRNPHARFNFSTDTRALYVTGCSRSTSAQLTVNGKAAARRLYHLNQHCMQIRFEKLEYDFQWTDFSATEDFKRERHRYVTEVLQGSSIVDIDMPTPLFNKRMVGEWTLGDPLGAGVHGRVFFASNTSGDVAAIKTMERTSKNHHMVDAEIHISKEVAALAMGSNDGERILQVIEVIYTKGEQFSSKMPFDNVAIVLKPLTPKTLANLIESSSKRGATGMKMETAAAFRDALEGVKVMHEKRWVHRDLKPANIGLVGNPPRSVLLDNGTAAYIQPGRMLRPKPGEIGTVGFLAPELELDDYDHGVDIWAMGVILYYLTYGHHPWNYALNPWRDVKECETLRSSFQKSYQDAINRMTVDYHRARHSPAAGYIHLGGLFIDMVRYRWATDNHEPRPDINSVLHHPAWGPLLPDSPQIKRQRGSPRPDDG